jgi:serine/threonine protein kinase
MLNINPEKRPKISEILDHPFFKEQNRKPFEVGYYSKMKSMSQIKKEIERSAINKSMSDIKMNMTMSSSPPICSPEDLEPKVKLPKLKLSLKKSSNNIFKFTKNSSMEEIIYKYGNKLNSSIASDEIDQFNQKYFPRKYDSRLEPAIVSNKSRNSNCSIWSNIIKKYKPDSKFNFSKIYIYRNIQHNTKSNR